jgi:glucose-6-phosphate isomerase
VSAAIELFEKTGFHAEFDGDFGTMTTDPPLRFRRVVRSKSDVSGVLLDGAGMEEETELYWIFQLVDAGPAASTFDERGVTYACVLLPSKKIGKEFVKTQGHYHPAMPGVSLEYPEVYSYLFGRIYLLMQRRASNRFEVLDDCVLIDMEEWGSVTIPPGYAHVLINPSAEPAAIAGLYSTAFQPDYGPFVGLKGAAYFLIDDAGERLVANAEYDQAPELRRLPAQSESAFVAPDPSTSLWTSFLRDPDRYAFITDPAAALARFGARE